MIYRLFLFFVGKCRISVSHDIIRIINMMARESLGADSLHMVDGVLVFELPLFRKRRLDALFKRYGFSYDNCVKSGLPHYLYSYRRRAGLFIGVLILIATVYASSSFVWRINVIGNETLDDTEVTDGLEALGFRVGSYIPSVNVKLLANEYLLGHPELAWMSINIIGNCVDVRVREALSGNDEDIGKDTPSVLVASRDGFIERIELENGEIIKNVGQTVREGETLVSGVIETGDGAFRLVRASAKVFAKTAHTFTVKIPYSHTKQTETPLDTTEYSIIFFSKSIRLPARSRPAADEVKILESSSYLTLPGGIPLPVGILTRSFYSTQSEQVTLDPESAERLAREEIARIISKDYKDSEVIAITLTPLESKDSYTLEVILTCIENIASEKVITTDDYKQTD